MDGYNWYDQTIWENKEGKKVHMFDRDSRGNQKISSRYVKNDEHKLDMA